MNRILVIIFCVGLQLLFSCKNKTAKGSDVALNPPAAGAKLIAEPPFARIPVSQDITIAGFFTYIGQIVARYDTVAGYPLTENLLLRANPWILDSLVKTDYYYQASLGNFVYNQPQMVVFKPGDTLVIPGPQMAANLMQKMAITRLDINIPAFEMRIMEGDSALFVFPVRVGKVQKKFLEMAGGVVDLRTRTGTGEIIRVNRNPAFYDPVTGKKFKYTKRDDQRTTLMPQIPWLEPAINGMRYGQMIHPTTNPRTLGRPASNGCIGTGEADAWRVYWFAPLGTKVLIRYDLEQVLPGGDTLRYEDIYRLRRKSELAGFLTIPGAFTASHSANCLCEDFF
jgi:lipoprotein-anchoring transpeptidase ErfK/SrfK